MIARAATLREAAALVDAVVADFALPTTVCAGCGYTRYDDFEQYKVAKELRALGDRLRRVAAQRSLAPTTPADAPGTGARDGTH